MRVCILATRIAGNDGVTLEAKHWIKILKRMGHKVELLAGELDTGGTLIPELHFQAPEVTELYEKVVYGKNNYRQVEDKIFEQAGKIEGKLRKFFGRKKIDLLIVPNVLSLPMHFSFAVALSRVLEETKIKTIARHHDFWWERDRFLKSHMFPFFERYFPPLLPNVKHVVINSPAQKEFERRTLIKPAIIWDTTDFDAKINRLDSFSKNWRQDFGITPNDRVLLQATRIVPRKRIELAIELLEKMADPKAILVIAGKAGDEGIDYEKYLRRLAKQKQIRVKFIGKFVNSRRRVVDYKTRFGQRKTRRIYTLWDCYPNADLITYPTALEGFGNQFVEAMYFKKPIVVSPYQVYKTDIRPLGFEAIEMEKVTREVVSQVRELLASPAQQERMVNKNFELGKRYLSYDWTIKRIEDLLKL